MIPPGQEEGNNYPTAKNKKALIRAFFCY